MLKVFKKISKAASYTEEIQHVLILPYESRKKGRFKAHTESGVEIGVFLKRGYILTDNDILLAESGEEIAIRSAIEAVTTVYCDDWLAFSRLCYHLGNRHVPLQIGDRWLRFMCDAVLEDLATHLGGVVKREQTSFLPENGAYGKHGQQPYHNHHLHDHHLPHKIVVSSDQQNTLSHEH